MGLLSNALRWLFTALFVLSLIVGVIQLVFNNIDFAPNMGGTNNTTDVKYTFNEMMRKSDELGTQWVSSRASAQSISLHRVGTNQYSGMVEVSAGGRTCNVLISFTGSLRSDGFMQIDGENIEQLARCMGWRLGR
jgi:hypothetical protein